MRPRHLLLALAVAAIWGSNFVVMRYGIERVPPLLFATLRFVFALVPAVFFIPRPAVAWRKLAAFGLLTGVGQFGLLFLALKSDISPGLASPVAQSRPSGTSK
jgi:O-acetylserine/cysteine efflux transporter